MTDRSRREAGLTLVEMLVALALIALIALAGFSLLDNTLRTQSRTEERLERVGQMQRAMFLLTTDLEQIAPGSLVQDGTTLGFNRADEEGRLVIRYALAEGALLRTVWRMSGTRNPPQRLLDGLDGLSWSFLGAGGEWQRDWVPDADADPDTAMDLPRAISLEMDIAARDGGPSGTLRRVVVVPAAAHLAAHGR